MTLAQSINRTQQSLWCEWPETEPLWCADETKEYLYDAQRYARLTTPTDPPPNQTRFKELNAEIKKITAPENREADLALAGGLLLGGACLGGLVGLALGALLLACYGVKDVEGGPPQPKDPHITNLVEVSGMPSITDVATISMVWTGSEYGIVWPGWNDSYQIFFSSLDAEGNRLTDEKQITNYFLGSGEFGGAVSPSLVWAESLNQYTLSWNTEENTGVIYLNKFDRKGNKIGGDVAVVVNTLVGFLHSSSLAWNDRDKEYGMAWVFNGQWGTKIMFSTIESTSSTVSIMEGTGSTVSIGGGAEFSKPSLIWSGAEYGLSWLEESKNCDSNEIKFVRLDSQGNMIGNIFTLASNNMRTPSLCISPGLLPVWTGSTYVFPWYGGSMEGEGEVFLTTLGEGGYSKETSVGDSSNVQIIPNPNEVAKSRPSLVWNGEKFGLAWVYKEGGNQGIYFAQIDSDENRIVGDRVTVMDNSRDDTCPPASFNPVLIWADGAYGVAWVQRGEGCGSFNDLYFARILLPN